MSIQAYHVKLTVVSATKTEVISKRFTLEGDTLNKAPGGNLV
jgi:hypothetical protein